MHEGLIYLILNYVGAKQLANKAKNMLYTYNKWYEQGWIFGTLARWYVRQPSKLIVSAPFVSLY
jgi:hypothetical protein